MIIKYKTNKGKSSLHFTCLPRIVGTNTNTKTHTVGGERERGGRWHREKEKEKGRESGIDTVALLFVRDGSGKDFRCRSQNGKKPTVIRWQENTKKSGRGGGWGGAPGAGLGQHTQGEEGSTRHANWAG